MNNIDNGTGTKETRLKIIRNEAYSEVMKWDTDNANDWSTATLQEELNGTYLESVASPSKEMIEDVVWKLGEKTYGHSNTASAFYTDERGTEASSERPTEWTGKIGLMYASDYGYATSGGSTTNRKKCLNTSLYNWDSYDDCFNNDWLYKIGTFQWTLTPSDGSSYVFRVYNDGRLNSSSAGNILAASPALCLTSNVRISGGEGTESSPYALSL